MENEKLVFSLRLLWDNYGENEKERPEYCAGIKDTILQIAAMSGIDEGEICAVGGNWCHTAKINCNRISNDMPYPKCSWDNSCPFTLKPVRKT